MNEVKETGGARIGMANATWPFATLSVDKRKLSLNASIIGNLIFKPSDITSIEPYTEIPIIGKGIRINHTVKNYKQKVIFWTFKNPNKVINQIELTGFLSNTEEISVKEEKEFSDYQSKGGFPIRKWVGILIIAIWNVLFFYDFYNFSEEKMPLGKGAQTATGFIFISCLLILLLEPVRNLVLKEGRKLEDIRKLLLFIMLITGIMFLQISTFIN